MIAASTKLDLHNKLDNDLFNHIAYVTNTALFILKKKGANSKSYDEIGKLLLRLLNVVRAYNAKRRGPSLLAILNIIDSVRKIKNEN